MADVVCNPAHSFLACCLCPAHVNDLQINLLSEPFACFDRMSDHGGDNSGTSTPRSAPGMSIDEFEIIKPISRGAFGRVYLARKHATGDLFAIKVSGSGGGTHFLDIY